MANKLSRYLDSFSSDLKIDAAVKESVAEEIYTHLEDKSQELEGKGLSEEEANNIATESFGSPQLIVRQIYEVHSQGTCQEAFFAALPHLLVALLFASYYWQSIVCLSSILITVTGVVVYGWCHNKPMWFFPWLGYYLLPVIVTGILLICLSQGWVWLATLAYIPLALFAIIYILSETASRDWLYVSFNANLPSCSVQLVICPRHRKRILSGQHIIGKIASAYPWIVVSFLVLAMATFIFTRVGNAGAKPLLC